MLLLAEAPPGAASCSGCHPANANAGTPMPRLAGQDASTTRTQPAALHKLRTRAQTLDKVSYQTNWRAEAEPDLVVNALARRVLGRVAPDTAAVRAVAERLAAKAKYYEEARKLKPGDPRAALEQGVALVPGAGAAEGHGRGLAP